LTILCYHSVQSHWTSPLAVEPADFERQCRWIARRRHVVPLREAIPRLDRTGRLPRGVAAMTFDDGFAALYDHAFPVLTRHRLPATVFLVAQTLTPQGRAVDWVDTPPPYPLVTLSLDQVLDMQAGGVEFQSHSFAHHTLTELGFAECVRDLQHSREFLSDVLGRHVTLLAYPRGRHDAGVRQAAQRAGYDNAFALPEHPEVPGPFAIPRVGVYQRNGMAAVKVKASRPYLRVRTDHRFTQAVRLLRRAAGRSG
jgi:peptidoglycan/xylan/chitin deacetylase (PgdA/CDA1 family)